LLIVTTPSILERTTTSTVKTIENSNHENSDCAVKQDTLPSSLSSPQQQKKQRRRYVTLYHGDSHCKQLLSSSSFSPPLMTSLPIMYDIDNNIGRVFGDNIGIDKDILHNPAFDPIVLNLEQQHNDIYYDDSAGNILKSRYEFFYLYFLYFPFLFFISLFRSFLLFFSLSLSTYIQVYRYIYIYMIMNWSIKKYT
jgi:hypothetical protein